MGSVERGTDAADVDDSDVEEIVHSEDLAQQFLKRGNKGVLTVIQDRMNAEALALLPAAVKRRLKALKNLQLAATNLEANFYQEVHELEIKYMKLYGPLFDKRAEIVNGKYEPTEEECKWEDSEEETEQLNEGFKAAKITEVSGDNEATPKQEKKQETEADKNIKGIPDFWLTIFRNVSMLNEMMQDYDEPIVRHLEDIKVILLHDNPMGFILEFHFGANEYFKNTILTKEYHMRCKPEDENPLEFEGPEIYNCKGCTINWNKGKNVTVKTIKKKQKHKSRGSVRTVTKSVQADSFFNFFSPPEMTDDNTSGLADDIQALMTSDFEIGHYIRERVVPRAVLLFTGEGLDDEDDDYEEEEEEEEESTEESEEEEEEEKGGRRQKGGHRARPRPNAPAVAANPADCKQQD